MKSAQAGTARCKFHNSGHAYTACQACEHQYCARVYAKCPRCAARAWARGTVTPGPLYHAAGVATVAELDRA